ncbi:FAD-binding protein [Adlercreutzia agrestimuris]|uniref:FAD-dependent oxidoreductase n=1 Tax=Adlercreutzia agrestimuris TaxID=2941324 RepID=UPI002040276A|nr:FAD-binding protein [Adlercreutzia agrestimuris]
MEKAISSPSRRDFLKAGGLALLGSAAAAGAFKTTAPLQAYADEAEGAAIPEKGIANFETDLYSEVFPTNVRFVPVVDAPTDMDRQGEVAFEMREIGEDELVRTEEVDVLVAGGGITGVCAALSASDDGKTQVLCLEKMSQGRGMFEGMGVTGGKAMEDGGYTCDKALMMDRMRHAAYYRVPIDPIKLWADRSPEAADWLQEKFDEGDMGIVEWYKENNPNAHNFDVPQTEIEFKCESWSEQTTKNAGGAGIYIVQDLANTISKRKNAEIRYRSAVVKLEREEGGRVTGAICKDAEGYFRVNAKNGVILATGGFDANPAMLKAWCRPEDIANAASWCPNYGTTGDGQLMGLAVGGQMDPLPAAVMNFDFGSPESFYSSNLGITGLVSGGLMINEQGRRFASESLPFQARSNAITAQRHYGENCWRVASTAQVPNEAVLEALEPFKEKGWAFEADSIAELASAMEVDSATLESEIERFNGFVDAQKDEDFNRPMEKAKKIEGEKYYAIKHQSSILATVSGLVVDYECRVLDYDNEPIAGLFAAGGASGGFFHTNYPRHIFGPSIGRCVTFGYVSGQSAAMGV